MTEQNPKRFTGRHMAAILIGGFAVVIGVNFTMASLASTTFGGVVVENSYVASQQFNTWLERARDSEALGYEVEARRDAQGRVVLATRSVPVGSQVTAMARHPLGRDQDRMLTFVMGPDNRWTSTATLPEGRWALRLAIRAGADEWRGQRALP